MTTANKIGLALESVGLITCFVGFVGDFDFSNRLMWAVAFVVTFHSMEMRFRK